MDIEKPKVTYTFDQERLDQNTRFDDEEGKIFFKTHFSREEERKNEIEYESTEKMCSFYVNDLECPDEVEFGNCKFQHD